MCKLQHFNIYRYVMQHAAPAAVHGLPPRVLKSFSLSLSRWQLQCHITNCLEMCCAFLMRYFYFSESKPSGHAPTSHSPPVIHLMQFCVKLLKHVATLVGFLSVWRATESALKTLLKLQTQAQTFQLTAN